MELGFGLGMYCIGGILLGLVLAVIIGIAISRQQIEEKRLAAEAKERLREYEAGEEAYRKFREYYPLTNLENLV